MATRKEVAVLAGVSEATVSRVLNGVGPMKEETRRKVLEAASRLNYYPNAIAQSFARQKSGNLGVVLPFMPRVHLFSTYYFSEVLSGIGSKANEAGYNLLLLYRSPQEIQDYSIYFKTQKIDACIFLGSRNTPQERSSLEQLASGQMPFVVVNQHYEGDLFLEVDGDHVQGGYEATRHMLQQGYTRIAFLNGPDDYSNSTDRLAGYKTALAHHGMKMDQELLFTGNYSRKSGYAASFQIAPLIRLGKIDAVFAANDRMAIGLMQGFAEQGIEIGGQAAIVGYDNSDAASFTTPPLTTVHVPFFEMGMLAAEKVLKWVEGTHEIVPKRHKLSTELVIRKSSNHGRV